MTSSRVSIALARLVRHRARDACEYCLLPQTFQEAEFHIDHVLPRVVRGATIADNLALACVGCSLRKAAQTSAIDPISLRKVPLFNPRQDVWTKHFQWDRRWRLCGRTAVARATIAALKLNRERLVEVRRDLAHLGRFPPS